MRKQGYKRKSQLCAFCPESHYGESKLCRDQENRLTSITYCEKWNNSQLSIPEDIEESMQRISDQLRDFIWMIDEVNRLSQGLGNDSKGSYDPTNLIHIRKKENHKRRQRLLRTITAIQQASTSIEDEREQTILDCLIQGLTLREIAKHLRVSLDTISKKKRTILKRLALAMNQQQIGPVKQIR